MLDRREYAGCVRVQLCSGIVHSTFDNDNIRIQLLYALIYVNQLRTLYIKTLFSRKWRERTPFNGYNRQHQISQKFTQR